MIPIVPIVLAVGAAGLLYEFLLVKPKAAVKPAPKGPTTPGGNPITVVVNVPVKPLLTVDPATNLPAIDLSQQPKSGQPTAVSVLQTTGQAVNAAHALHDYLRGGSSQGMQYAGSNNLVLAFQNATMTDPLAIALGGPLPKDGVFGAATSGALTMYTGDPIPADPSSVQPPPPDKATAVATALLEPGAAATSSFNMKMYFKSHPHDPNNANEIALVKQFQHDVNTDTKSFGPASLLGFKLVTVPLQEDGQFGPYPPKAPGAGESHTAAAYRLMYGPITDP